MAASALPVLDSIAMSTMTYEARPLPARNESLRAADTPFQRPGAEDLSEAIPVFFIGRNKLGHWVARGADGKSGGLFWRKQAAIRFARRSAWPARCATIFPAENIELDLENQGNPLLSRIDVTRMLRNRRRRHQRLTADGCPCRRRRAEGRNIPVPPALLTRVDRHPGQTKPLPAVGSPLRYHRQRAPLPGSLRQRPGSFRHALCYWRNCY